MLMNPGGIVQKKDEGGGRCNAHGMYIMCLLYFAKLLEILLSTFLKRTHTQSVLSIAMRHSFYEFSMKNFFET